MGHQAEAEWEYDIIEEQGKTQSAVKAVVGVKKTPPPRLRF